MKRVLFLSLALVICLSLASTAFAAQTVTKVENGVEFVLIEPDLQTRADVINGYPYDCDGDRESDDPANRQHVGVAGRATKQSFFGKSHASGSSPYY